MLRGALLAFCLILASVAGSAPLQAQDRDETNTQVSVGYEYRHRIKERVRGFGDLQYEELLDPHSLFGDRNQLSTTGGVSCDAGKRFRIEGGLGLYYTDLPDATDTFETRFWQAATLDWPDSLGVLRRYVLSHRFKLEERFKRTTDWDFALRFRYRLAFAIPVNRYTVEPGAFFVPLKAEFYMPIGNEVEELFAKRARFTAGLGHVFSKSWTAVLRYAWQRSRDTIGADFQTTDQFIEFRIKTQVRIRDLLKSR